MGSSPYRGYVIGGRETSIDMRRREGKSCPLPRRPSIDLIHLADAAVGGKDDDGRQRALQRTVEECEALNVQHVHLVHKQHAGHELGHALVNVPEGGGQGSGG